MSNRPPVPFPNRLTASVAVLALSLSLSLSLRVSAQLPLCRLTSLFPAGAQVGTTTELAVGGSDLDEADRLLFSDPRIVASVVSAGEKNFKVTVPPGLPPGPLEVRLAGRFGVSNPRAFTIGTAPEITTPPTNTSAATAVEIAPEIVANGRMQPNAALWYRSRAEPGQRLVARVATRELDSRLVPDLTISDSAGRELGIARRRGWLEFVAPADGICLVRISDQTYRGGDEFGYRLTVSAAPYIEFAVPEVLRAGETNVVTLFGRLLPGSRRSTIAAPDDAPWEELEVEVAAPPGGLPAPGARKPAASLLTISSFPWAFASGAFRSDPLIFGLTTQVVAIASWSAGVTGPVRIMPPCELAGLFPPQGAASVGTFEAKKGETFSLELFADRLGIHADPWAVVQRALTNESGALEYKDVSELSDNDSNSGGREFDTSTRDAAARFQAPEDGTYHIRLRDLFQGGKALRRLPFWMSLRRETPDFRLAAFPQPPPRLNDNDKQIHLWTTVLRRGETVPIRVLALRRDGFDREIELAVTNLPNGVSAWPAKILAGQNATSLLLSAAPDAAVADAEITILGRANSGETELIHAATPGSSSWQVADWDLERGNGRPALGLAVSVCGVETAPVSLAPIATNSFEVAAGSKVAIPFSVRRQDAFPAAFKVKAQGPSEIEKLKEFDIAEKATNATLEINLADAKLPPGTHTIWLQALVAGKYRNNPEAIALAETEMKAAEQAATSASTEAKAAAEEKRKAAEMKKKAAEEKAKPRDVTVAVYSQPFTLKVLPPPGATETKK